MGLSIANILLQVTGDSDDARRELEAVSRDLALFGRETAEAEVDVNTEGARANLEELEIRLSEFGADDHSTEVNVLIAKAQADIAVLQAELDRIDKEEVTVDVDVRRGVAEKIASLVGQIDRLDTASGSAAEGGISSLISGFSEAFKGASIFGVGLRTLAVAAPIVIPVIVAIAGQIAAVVASAGSAVLGLGALAVALTATLLPALALGVGAIANFKEDAETAGTAANDLAEAFSGIGDAFKEATSGGSDAIFEGLAEGVKGIKPLLDELKPAFTNLGKAGGEALKELGEKFTSPEWGKFFTFLTDSLGELTPLLTKSFGAFADTLKNISTAAMPFLVDGFRDMGKWLKGIADQTSDIDGLEKSIGGMVDSLKAWGKLLGGSADLASAFVEAFAPFGDSIVESLAEGAHNLADWLRSEEGLERIGSFFEDMGPLASEVGKLILNLGVIFVQVGQFFAPLAAAVVAGFNKIAEAVSDAIDWLTKVDRALAFKNWGSAFSSIADGASSAASAAFDWIKGAVEKIAALVAVPINFVLDFADDINARARAIWDSVKGAIEDAIKFVLQFASDLPSRARSIWGSVKGAITDAIKFVLQFASDLAGRARNIWDAVKGVVTDAINFVLSLPGDLASRARGIWDSVKGVISDAINFVLDLPGVGGLVSAAKAIWDAINDALPDISINIDIPKPSIPHIDVPGLAGGVRDKPTSGWNLVGEEGPELRFIPKGADVFTVGETQRILRALAGGVSAPAVAASGGGPAIAGGGDTYYDVKVVSPGTGSPDPDVAAAKWNATLRARGALG